jgi:hypothetical protein
MKTVLLKSQVSVWFDYLKIADRLGLKVAWAFYKPWGSQEEIRQLRFGTWWRTRGRSLFEASAESQIEVVGSKGGYVDIRIPAHWTVRQVRKEIGPVFSTVRTKDAPRGTQEFNIKGRFSYGDFVSYKRVLELDLNARDRGQREKMGNLISAFRAEEQKRKDRAARATATSSARAAQKGRRRHKKFKAIEVRVTPNEQRNGYIWLKKARRIAANVAKGEFPGGNRS